MKVQFLLCVLFRIITVHATAIPQEGAAFKSLEGFFEDLVDNLWHSSSSKSTAAEMAGKRWTGLTEDEQFAHFKQAMDISPDESLDSFKSKVAATDLAHDDLHDNSLFIRKGFLGNNFVSSEQHFLISHIPEEKRTPAQNEWLRVFPAVMFDRKTTWDFKEMTEVQRAFIVDQTLASEGKRVQMSSLLAGDEPRWIVHLPPAQQRWIMTRPIETLTRREFDWMIEKEGSLRPVESRRVHLWLKSFFQIGDAEASLVVSASTFTLFLESFFKSVIYAKDSPEKALQLKFIFRYFHDDPSDTGKRIFQELSIQQALHQVDLLS